MLMRSVIFFFFKQKTAYEMRISDWSSDVCSSDLIGIATECNAEPLPDALRFAVGNMLRPAKGQMFEQMGKAALRVGFEHRADEIGRASCRERVCQYE